MPEVILILGLSSLILFLKKFNRHKTNILVPAVLAYTTIFLYLISSSAVKGGVRYALPLFPWIYLASGWVINKLEKSKHAYKSLALAIIIFLASYPIMYFPNYYLYYNTFIGGPRNAVKYDLFGLCFGSKEALEYLDKNGPSGLTGVIGCSDTASYHSGRTLTKNFIDADILIVESSFVQQHPDSKLLQTIRNKRLIKEILQQGVVTARIYQ